jgi:uncharacterized protein
MNTTQQKTDLFFRKAGLWFYDHRLIILLACIVLTALALQTLKNLRMDVSIEGYLKKEDPILANYHQFRKDFDNDELIVVGVETDKPFDLNFLRKLEDLHDALAAQVPYIDDITSLVNVRNTRGENDTLIVEDLLERFPATPREAEALKQRTAENEFYKNLVISQDLKTTAVVIRLLSFSPQTADDLMQEFGASPVTGKNLKKLSVKETGQAVEKVRDIIKEYRSEDFRTYLSGTAAVDHYLITIIPVDTKKFMKLAYLAVIILLALIFRRISGVVIPVVIVSLILVFTLALFPATGVPVKHPTQTLPSFLLAVSICYSIHILALFYYYVDKGIGNRRAVGDAMAHSGKAILLTGITTAAGLFSFAGSRNAPIGDLGFFAGSGVFIAFLLTLILLPCLISFVPERKRRRKTSTPLLDRVLIKIAVFSTRNAPWILACSALLLVPCIAGFSLIKFSHNTLKWLPKSAAIRTDTQHLDDRLKGTISMEIIIDTGRENGLYDPGLMKRIDGVTRKLNSLSTQKVATGKAWSITEIVKETNKALHNNDDAMYRIPDNRDLLIQELFLFSNSGSDDLEDFTDSLFSKARISVKLPFTDAIAYHEYIRKVNGLLNEEFPDVSVTSTGLIMIYAQVIANAISDMKLSYIIALSAITVLMILLTGDIRIGFISMIPNLFPVIFVIGIAGFLKVPFSLFIMLIGNIVMGLAVDDTIHFIHNFKTYYLQGNGCQKAVEKTFLTTGRAMLLTSMILCSAFFIYLFSSLYHLKDFGMLAGLAVLLALAADFFVTSALMTVFYSRPAAKPVNQEPAISGPVP